MRERMYVCPGVLMSNLYICVYDSVYVALHMCHVCMLFCIVVCMFVCCDGYFV